MAATMTTRASVKKTTDESNGETMQSYLYRIVMTPVNFITFLVSLYAVDWYYQDQRAQRNAERQSRPPRPLYALLYGQQPYQWVIKDQSCRNPPETSEERWHYHTMQRKLFKMEASDAFGMSRVVLIGLVLTGLGLSWLIWSLTVLVWSWFA